jgi:hypothetical protein
MNKNDAQVYYDQETAYLHAGRLSTLTDHDVEVVALE